MEELYFKESRWLWDETKSQNKVKESVSAMCAVLQLPRRTYCYEAKERPVGDDVTQPVIQIFKIGRTYGT